MTRDELLRAWVDALESGKYKQGAGALRRDDKYCCLGVLCDLTGEGRWTPSPEDALIQKDRWVLADGSYQINELSDELAVRVTLRNEQEQELVHANDSGEPFPKIAQRIREMFPDVFATVDA